MTDDIVIVAAQRTAVGKFGGTLAKTPAPDLGAHVVKGLLAKAGVPGDAISEVIMGQVLTAGSGQNPARQTVIKSGLPNSVPAMTINKVCGSGLKAVMLAAQAIRAGDAVMVKGSLGSRMGLLVKALERLSARWSTHDPVSTGTCAIVTLIRVWQTCRGIVRSASGDAPHAPASRARTAATPATNESSSGDCGIRLNSRQPAAT